MSPHDKLSDNQETNLPTAYRARWLFPVNAPPIPEGTLEVDVHGRIAAIRQGRDFDALDLGDVAIIPALVNAHAHLEFSNLISPVSPALPFPKWVEKVVSIRKSRTASIDDILRQGLREMRRGGTLAVGEIATCDIDAYRSQRNDLSLCLFREIIGPLAENWPDLLAQAESHLAECANHPGIAGGLSPHAPYTVPQELFERIIELAIKNHAPVAVHLAETASERELLAARGGELVEMMRRLALWNDALHPPGRNFSDWIAQLAKCRHGLIVHGNYLNDRELDLIAEHENLTLVYCPRTHAYFKHPPHPICRLLERGGRLALGTDGRSSNPDLSLLAEANFLARRHPGVPSDTILEMITRNPAEALGLGDRAGVLAVGREANFLAVDVREEQRSPVLFQAEQGPSAVFHHGVKN